MIIKLFEDMELSELLAHSDREINHKADELGSLVEYCVVRTSRSVGEFFFKATSRPELTAIVIIEEHILNVLNADRQDSRVMIQVIGFWKPLV